MSPSIAGTALLASSILLLASDLALARKDDPATFRFKPLEVNRSLFSGNETLIGNVSWMRHDCTAATPDIRVVTQPKKGALCFEETRLTVTASKTELDKKCHGKPVNAVLIYYRSDEKFAGRDKIVLEVDAKVGAIRRQTYLI